MMKTGMAKEVRFAMCAIYTRGHAHCSIGEWNTPRVFLSHAPFSFAGSGRAQRLGPLPRRLGHRVPEHQPRGGRERRVLRRILRQDPL
jgi:hypothetical protein